MRSTPARATISSMAKAGSEVPREGRHEAGMQMVPSCPCLVRVRVRVGVRARVRVRVRVRASARARARARVRARGTNLRKHAGVVILGGPHQGGPHLAGHGGVGLPVKRRRHIVLERHVRGLGLGEGGRAELRSNDHRLEVAQVARHGEGTLVGSEAAPG